MYTEDDLLPISALQHLLFCERRAALVHIEGLWNENTFTVEGTHLHERSEEAGTEVRGDLRVVRGLRLRSLRLGLSGKADVVEFQRAGEGAGGVRLEGVSGFWKPMPVEYKRGRLRREEGYEVQLCAHAICLEEMLGGSIAAGSIFYGQPRRRLEVIFDEKLRCQTAEAAARLHELIRLGKTPAAVYEKKCESCSLKQICLPKTSDGRHSARKYLSESMAEVGADGK